MKKALITGITGQDGANIAEHLGDIEAERFIALIQREPFDYTKWRERLDEDLPIETISRKAMELRKKLTTNRIHLTAIPQHFRKAPFLA